MKKLTSLARWIDENILKILVVGFIFFIPLYPKIPLKSIGYTYISIRLEDLYVAILSMVFLLQLLRKKVVFRKKFLFLFLGFWAAVFLSFLYGVYVKKNLPYHQLAFLNSLRRVEYMSVFFIAMSAIKTKNDLVKYLKFFAAVLLLVCFYGIGQKFLGWPAVQTMNPAYSQGYLLFLTPEARISSSFGGHYDLAAYLVLMMPIILGMFFNRKNWLYFGIALISIFALVLTAARSSYAAYLVSVPLFLLIFRKFKILLIVIAVTAVLTLTQKNLTSRLTRTFQVKQIFVNQNTGQVIVPQKISTKEVPAGSFYLAPIELSQTKNSQTNSFATSANEKMLDERLHDQVREEAAKKGRTLTLAEEDILVASLSARLQPITTVVSDISFATRLQVEWPRALKAFFRNPILGSGPSSITEATDNDFLRTLGEFGLLGTILFGLIIMAISRYVLVKSMKQKEDQKILYFGFLFGLLAILINATYIDVFEASKVAFQFWALAGLYVGSLLIL